MLYSSRAIPDAGRMSNASAEHARSTPHATDGAAHESIDPTKAALSSAGLSPAGMALAVGCYVSWGLTPIYWKGISGIAAAEVLVPRILWTLVLLLVGARLLGRSEETWAARGVAWGWSLLAACLLALNWGVFIYAVQTDRVMATSLGYYINPLMVILLGLLVVGERLNPVQVVAVSIAAIGVAWLTIDEGRLPWISLVLALSFALYGLLHKLRPQPPLAGLLREMLVLAPITLAVLAFWIARGESALVDRSLAEHAYLSLTGIVTAGPLLLFHAATKQLPLFAVGMFQYIAPTLTLTLATLVYGEAFTGAHAVGFGLVWIGLVVFTIDSFRRSGSFARRQRVEHGIER